MADSSQYDQATLLRRQQIADAMLSDAMKPREIRHWAQGLAQLADAGVGGYLSNKADRDLQAAKDKETGDLYGALGLPAPAARAQEPGIMERIGSMLGGGFPAAPPQPQAAPAQPQAAPAGDASRAIANIESGGAYDKLGPVTKGDRAYGKYQVMGANIPEWTQAALGKPMSPQEFIASPDAQEAVFKHRFGQYVDKYGPEGAAKAWFAGEKGMSNPNARDVLGTSVADYGRKFMSAYAPTGQPAPYQVAGPPTAAPQGAPQASPVAAAMSGSAPAPAPSAAPSGGLLADVPAERRAQIAAMITSSNPATKQIGLALLTQAMKPQEYGFQTQPDGTILRTDPRKGTVEPIYQGATKPTFGVIGETEDGKKSYGFIDTVKGKVTPLEAPKPGDERPTVTGPDGKEIVIPKGVDVPTFKKEISKINADAAGGKMTEVQAKASSFATRMESAEKSLNGLENEGTGLSGAAQQIAGNAPVVGSALQSSNYQKFSQAKSQFITAMLRQESGAAINKEEFRRYDKELFPQPGDGPEVIAQKAETRRQIVDQMRKAAGPGYKSSAQPEAPKRITKSIGGKNYYQENGQWFEE